MDYYQWMVLLSGLGAIIAVTAAIIAARRGSGTRGTKAADAGNSPEGKTAVAAASPATADGALVAAIAAAIYAATGAAPGSLRIASIQPSPAQEGGFNTPVWGRVERFAQR